MSNNRFEDKVQLNPLDWAQSQQAIDLARSIFEDSADLVDIGYTDNPFELVLVWQKRN